MGKPNLRTVKPDEKAARPTPKTITAAVESGSARDVLASMRRALAKKLDEGDVSSNAIASAYKELRELDRLIRQSDAEDAEEEARHSVEHGRSRRSFNASAL